MWATFARPIAGVSCPRAERRPQPAVATQPCGAAWPMECTSSAAGTARTAAASVSTVLVRRNAPVHSGIAEVNVSMTFTFLTARRMEKGF